MGEPIHSSLQIGEVAKRAKASIHTIRYYEKMGLMSGPARSGGGFRLYGEDAVQRLLFIQKAKDLGLTLEEILQITCCGEKGLEPCCDMTVKLFSRKIEEFEGKIKELQQTKKKLKTVLGGWAGKKRKK
jgi:DNA-binding transcriptional MerR regulator